MDRYIRQETFIGKKAQKKLESSKVCIVGVGALGTLCAELLVRSGISSLVLIDYDLIELDNLQRQHLFGEKDVGKYKVRVAKKYLSKINSNVEIIEIKDAIDETNLELLESNLVLDCVDNLETSYILNDYCKSKKIPFVFGSAIRNEGYILAVPEVRRVFRNVKTFEKCATQGVMNTITSLISSVQVNEAIKILIGKKPEKNLLRFDLEKNEFLKIKV